MQQILGNDDDLLVEFSASTFGLTCNFSIGEAAERSPLAADLSVSWRYDDSDEGLAEFLKPVDVDGATAAWIDVSSGSSMVVAQTVPGERAMTITSPEQDGPLGEREMVEAFTTLLQAMQSHHPTKAQAEASTDNPCRTAPELIQPRLSEPTQTWAFWDRSSRNCMFIGDSGQDTANFESSVVLQMSSSVDDDAEDYGHMIAGMRSAEPEFAGAARDGLTVDELGRRAVAHRNGVTASVELDSSQPGDREFVAELAVWLLDSSRY